MSKIKLENVSEIVSGFAFKGTDFSDSEGVPVVRISNITDDGGVDLGVGGQKFFPKKIDDSFSKFKIQRGDILVALSGATTGKIGSYQDDKEALLNQRVARIRALNDSDNNYLYYFLISKSSDILNDAYGGAQPNISPKTIGDYELFYPDKKLERRRITSVVDAQFTRLNAVIKSLKTIKQKLEVYRKSVLKAAFVLENKAQKISRYCEVVSGATPGTTKKDNWGGDILWITPKDLSGYKDKYIDKTWRTITKKGYESCSTTLIPSNNVLMSSRAPIGYVVINKKPICTNQGFKSFVIKDRNELNEEFLYYQFKAQMDEIKKAGSGTTFSEISKIKAESILIKVPTLTVQKKIVSQVESQFSVIDKLEEAVDKALLKADRLRKSILKSAFEGKLV